MTQPWATFCIQVPAFETSRPTQSSRKSRLRSAPNRRGSVPNAATDEARLATRGLWQGALPPRREKDPGRTPARWCRPEGGRRGISAGAPSSAPRGAGARRAGRGPSLRAERHPRPGRRTPGRWSSGRPEPPPRGRRRGARRRNRPVGQPRRHLGQGALVVAGLEVGELEAGRRRDDDDTIVLLDRAAVDELLKRRQRDAGVRVGEETGEVAACRRVRQLVLRRLLDDAVELLERPDSARVGDRVADLDRRGLGGLRLDGLEPPLEAAPEREV